MGSWLIIYLSLLVIVGIAVLLGLAWGVLNGSETTEQLTRTCPVCGRELGMDERVFADRVERANQADELKIKGCSQCYRRDME